MTFFIMKLKVAVSKEDIFLLVNDVLTVEKVDDNFHQVKQGVSVIKMLMFTFQPARSSELLTLKVWADTVKSEQSKISI